MRHLRIIWLLAVVGLVGTPVPAATAVGSDQVVTGTTHGGAFYRIEVPVGWNGDLVIWNHGFTLSPPEPLEHDDLGLVDLQLSQGYAVAASSYQQSGWALFETRHDLDGLYKAFRKDLGKPDEVLVYGASLGGIVTAQAIEKAHIGNVVGAMPVCGALAGSRNWDAALDLRLIYDAVAADVPGGAIPGGAEGLPEGSTFTQKSWRWRSTQRPASSYHPPLGPPSRPRTWPRSWRSPGFRRVSRSPTWALPPSGWAISSTTVRSSTEESG